MTRRRFVVGNWKMNLNEQSAGELAGAIVAGAGDVPDADLGVAPPFPFLRRVLDRVEGSRLAVGAQDVHWEDRGAFTGAVAPPMLAAMGVGFAIVGHSERRRMFGEDDAAVARKTAALLEHDLAPIVCIGETEAERLAEQTLSVVARQVREGLSTVASDVASRVTIAYEPVWAIGTGRVPTADQVVEVHAFVRARLTEMFGGTARVMRVLYGGSVTADNATELLALDDVDGALVGGASLDSRQFLAIASAGAAR